MTEKETTPPATTPPATTPPATTPPAADPGLVATIKQVVQDLLGKENGTPAGPAATRRTRDAAVADDVRQAIRDVHAEEAENDRITELVGEVNTLKAAVQKPPQVVRKVERWMGWRSGEDE
jgi:hypothetical protein